MSTYMLSASSLECVEEEVPKLNLQKRQTSAKTMDVQPSCFLSGAFATVLRVSRFAGTAPLHFVKKKSGWCVNVSTGFSMYGYFMVTIINLLAFGTLITELQMDQKTDTRQRVRIFQSALMLVLAGKMVYGAPGQMRSLIDCLNRVQKISSELNVQNWMSSERPMISLIIFWAITTITLSLAEYAICIIYYKTWTGIIYLFCYFCCYWILQLRKIQLVMITLHVKYSFEIINENLKSLLHVIKVNLDPNTKPHLVTRFYNRPLKDNNKYNRFNNFDNYLFDVGKTSSDGVTKSTNSHCKTVRHLALVYTSACDVVRDMDRNHGPIVLIMLGSLLLHLVCTPYFFITNLSHYNPSYQFTVYVIELIVQAFWCLFHLFNLVMIIEPCQLTHDEMEKTRVLLSHLLNCTNSAYEPLAVELDLFYRHLILNEVSYMPLKVTTATRTLVVTILGSITTYLVVMIQL